jgi:soluble lytic murein transglycosylase
VRLDRLLWQDRQAEAKRMLPRVGAGWRALAEARLALRADADGVNALIERVPAALQGDPGLSYERFDWRFRRDRDDEAAELVIAQSQSAAALGDAVAWADRRAALARSLLGWQARHDLARMCADSWRWQSTHPNGFNP